MIDPTTATQLVYERIRTLHPDWKPRDTWVETCRAIGGAGDFADYWRHLRGMVPPAEQPSQEEMTS